MTDAPAELVHYAVADAVATITLDSPANRNALSRQLVTELFAHLEPAGADDAVRVVLVESSRQGLLLGRRPHRGERPRAWRSGPAGSSTCSGSSPRSTSRW